MTLNLRLDALRDTRGDAEDRPGAAPSVLPHVAAMTWRDGAFVHWPIDPDVLRPQVPDSLKLDTYDGQAWLSVLPFVLARAGIRASPAFARLTVPELNVRTYVRYRDNPGLFFFSIDLDSAVVATIVNRLTRLPCHRAMMHVGGTDDRVTFSSSRTSRGEPSARFSATYEPAGDVFYAEPDSLAHWLTARRRFYAPSDRGVLTGEIAHAPWPLQPVDITIHENTTFEANDLPEPDGEPVTHYCGELEMTGSILRRFRE